MLAIEIKNLKFRYEKEGSYVLNDLSLNIEKGEYVTIMGHNGSGKSTLAKLIIGLLEAEEGSITVLDQEMNEENVRSIRFKVGIVFQNPDNQFIGATVRDDIAFGLENHCVEHSQMEEIIQNFAQKVNMENFLDKEPSALSGGQKQRVAIAGVLSMKPEIIILDEATAMLDPRGKNEIINLVHQLKSENPSLTILSITHDQEEARLSDRVIILDKGQVVMNDRPEKIFVNYEELIKMGLDIPFFDKLKFLLGEQGIDVSKCNSLEEVKNLLCR